ncbi:phage tail protein [Vogesella sp. EB]|uniref:phage tail protein n=1 Tax=Vogesella sp. EB TaxID=1526735 RepID=UPI00069EA154|nr:phage tail protein [Vogesella sp. EB]
MNPLKEWTNGTPENNYQDGTQLDAADFESWSKELVAVLTSAGIAPDAGEFDQLLSAIKVVGRRDAASYAQATGTANTVAVDYTPAVTELVDGMVLRFSAAHSNTGAVTFSPNELPAKPVRGLAVLPLQGGEIVTGGRCLVMYSQALDAWLLLASTGGALQVPDAVHPDQAPTLRQVEEIAGQSGGYLLEVKWWQGTRAGIPAGYGPNDGQLLNRATYPDVWAMIAAGTVPVVSDAVWLADPTKRGCYSTGDGATTFRLPDYNGKHAGSLGAVFLRGDGTMSAAVAGAIQPDAFQGHTFALPLGTDSLGGSGVQNYRPIASANTAGAPISDGVNGAPRTASETRPLNVTGCWIVKLFGSVINPGAVDAAQLASDLVALTARVSTLESNQRLTKEYVSTEQVITAGGLLTLAHGLGVEPKLVTGQLVCKTADNGYAVGAVIEMPLTNLNSTAANAYGCNARKDATNVYIRYGANAALWPAVNGTTGAYATLTSSSWRLVVRAFA